MGVGGRKDKWEGNSEGRWRNEAKRKRREIERMIKEGG